MGEIQEPVGWTRGSGDPDTPRPEREVPKNVFDIADILLKDRDDLVQKGRGCMLKRRAKRTRKRCSTYS